MKTPEEIRLDAFNDALTQISSLTSALAVVNFSLIIYLYYISFVVVGVPDDYSVFGIKFTPNELIFAMLASAFMNYWIYRNIYFIYRCLQNSLLPIDVIKESIMRRHLLFNPFLYEESNTGHAFLFINNLTCTVIYCSLPLAFIAKIPHYLFSPDSKSDLLVYIPILILSVIFIILQLRMLFNVYSFYLSKKIKRSLLLFSMTGILIFLILINCLY
jgi:hypothetical protein